MQSSAACETYQLHCFSRVLAPDVWEPKIKVQDVEACGAYSDLVYVPKSLSAEQLKKLFFQLNPRRIAIRV